MSINFGWDQETHALDIDLLFSIVASQDQYRVHRKWETFTMKSVAYRATDYSRVERPTNNSQAINLFIILIAISSNNAVNQVSNELDL